MKKKKGSLNRIEGREGEKEEGGREGEKEEGKGGKGEKGRDYIYNHLMDDSTSRFPESHSIFGTG